MQLMEVEVKPVNLPPACSGLHFSSSPVGGDGAADGGEGNLHIKGGEEEEEERRRARRLALLKLVPVFVVVFLK